jgi:hypothetical protein
VQGPRDIALLVNDGQRLRGLKQVMARWGGRPMERDGFADGRL